MINKKMLRYIILRIVMFSNGISSSSIRDKISEVFDVPGEEVRKERESMRSEGLIDFGGDRGQANFITTLGEESLSETDKNLIGTLPNPNWGNIGL